MNYKDMSKIMYILLQLTIFEIDAGLDGGCFTGINCKINIFCELPIDVRTWKTWYWVIYLPSRFRNSRILLHFLTATLSFFISIQLTTALTILWRHIEHIYFIVFVYGILLFMFSFSFLVKIMSIELRVTAAKKNYSSIYW